MPGAGRLLVGINNLFAGFLAKGRYKPGDLLLLFPHCLQHGDCDRKIVGRLENCRRCGRCKVKGLIEIAEERGVRAVAAAGGELAAEEASGPGVKAIVAVACEKELRQGILAIFPKKVFGIVNRRPNGPCLFTDVDLDEVRGRIEFLLGGGPGEAGGRAGDGRGAREPQERQGVPGAEPRDGTRA